MVISQTKKHGDDWGLLGHTKLYNYTHIAFPVGFPPEFRGFKNPTSRDQRWRLVAFKAVHLGEELIHGLLALIVAYTERSAMGCGPDVVTIWKS